MSAHMYREMILDLNRNPLNYGELDPRDFSHEEDNPLCGDVIRVDVRLGEGGRIADISWSGDGCAISQASASLLTDHVKGMSLEDVMQLESSDMYDLLEFEPISGRVKCATLALITLKAGAFNYSNQNDLTNQRQD